MAGMAGGDYGPLFQSFSEDVRWHVIGATKFSGTITGKQEVLAKRMRPFRELMKPPLIIKARNFISEGEFVAVEADGQGVTKDGKPYNPSYCMIFRVKDGVVTEFTEYFDTDVSVTALGR